MRSKSRHALRDRHWINWAEAWALLCAAATAVAGNVAQAVVPKNTEAIVVLYLPLRNAGGFGDNAKYLFLYLANELAWPRVTYITTCRETVRCLQAEGYRARLWFSWGGLWELLRAGTVYGTHTHTFRMIRGYVTKTARTVQMWHGVGVKKNAGMLNRKYHSAEGWVQGWTWRLERRFASVDYACFSSKTQAAKRGAIVPHRHALINGQPKAEGLVRHHPIGWDDIGGDRTVLNELRRVRAEGIKKILVIALTWRRGVKRSGGAERYIHWAQLNDVARDVGIVICVKRHPNMGNGVRFVGYSNILTYDANACVTPLLREADILVTDYSSIFSDFYHLHRPVIFFNPDYEDAVESGDVAEEFVMNPPGLATFTFEDLVLAIQDESYDSVRFRCKQEEWLGQVNEVGPMGACECLVDLARRSHEGVSHPR